jgi:hypothetical protein
MKTKKLLKASIVVLAVAALCFASSAQAGIIFDDGMSTLTGAGWSEGSNAVPEAGDNVGGIYVIDLDPNTNPGPDAVQFNSWAEGAGWTSIWTNSEVVIQNDREYTLTVNMMSFIGGGQAVPFSMQSVDAGDVWTGLVSSAPVVSDVAAADYSVSFSTMGGANAGIVGDKIGIGISPDWWNNGMVDNVSISVIPEPTSMLLVLVGGMLLAPSRRR